MLQIGRSVVRFQMVSLEFFLLVAQWLRRCATNRKVGGSIPDGVTRIFFVGSTVVKALCYKSDGRWFDSR